MAQELKACPFCGGKAEAVQFTRKRWTVECFADGCGAGIISHGDMQAAISTWNTRAQLPSQGGEAVAELSSDEILMAFEENGFRIEPGASFSAKGQIAQLLNAVGAILSAHPADQVAEPGTKAVPVDLLVLIEQSWRVPNGLPKSVPEHVEQKIIAGLSQLRALLNPSPQ